MAGREIGDAVGAARDLAGADAVWLQHDSTDADGYEGLVTAASDTAPTAGEVSADDPLLVIYTAAIIDRPGGSMLAPQPPDDGRDLGRITGTDHAAVFVNSGPLFHIGNFQFESLSTFLMGGTNIYVRRVEAAEIPADRRREGHRGILMPPTIFEIGKLNKTRVSTSAACVPERSRRCGATPCQPTDLWAASPAVRPDRVTGLALLRGFGEPGLGNGGRPSPFTR